MDTATVQLNFDQSRPITIKGHTSRPTNLRGAEWVWRVEPVKGSRWMVSVSGVTWRDRRGCHFVPWMAVAEIVQYPASDPSAPRQP